MQVPLIVIVSPAVVRGANASGSGGVKPFFMLPFGLQQQEVLDQLFDKFEVLRAASETQATRLSELGYGVPPFLPPYGALVERLALPRNAGVKPVGLGGTS